mmetsp:Transcript_103170/g.321520  ORF Transcript_103170/g.321520 Transcript_103170/m.321520 type:complete len:241 (-) Transcript_103170:639-1361(-)
MLPRSGRAARKNKGGAPSPHLLADAAARPLAAAVRLDELRYARRADADVLGAVVGEGQPQGVHEGGARRGAGQEGDLVLLEAEGQELPRVHTRGQVQPDEVAAEGHLVAAAQLPQAGLLDGVHEDLGPVAQCLLRLLHVLLHGASLHHDLQDARVQGVQSAAAVEKATLEDRLQELGVRCAGMEPAQAGRGGADLREGAQREDLVGRVVVDQGLRRLLRAGEAEHVVDLVGKDHEVILLG